MKSKPTRIIQTDLDPDGVRIVVDWDRFVPGSSVFIPCVNTKEAVKQVCGRLGFSRAELKYRATVCDGYYGVRIWRLKTDGHP